VYCRIYTEGIFGIRPTGLYSFDIRPQMPADWNYMSLKSIRAFKNSFDVVVIRKGKKLEVTIKNENGVIRKKQINPGESVSIRLL